MTMINIEIEYPSLAEAYERGPADIFERVSKSSCITLIEAPTYCERDGKGVLSAAGFVPSYALEAIGRERLAESIGGTIAPIEPAAEEPRALVVTVSSL